MPRGRRKGRGGLFHQAERQGSQDSSGPPRVKSKLDMDDEGLGVESMSHFCSPQRSFREKITDFFTSYDDANAEREGSVSPPMPILTPQVGNPRGMEGLGLEGLSTPPRLMTPEPHMAPRLTTPDPDDDQEDGGSEQSEGSSSGKENDGEPPTLWRGSRGSLTSRGSRPRSGCLTDLQPLQQHQNHAVNKANNGVVGNVTGKGNPAGGKLMLGSSSNVDTAGNNSASPLTSASVTSPAALTKEARGRVTRSSLGKAPLSLKSCEQLQNEFNILDGVHGREVAAASASSPPTPHKIIRVKEPGLCNPLQKLKQISLTPKKTIRTKRNKTTNKRLAVGSGGVTEAPSPASKAGKLAQAASSSHKVTEYFPIRRSERKPKGELLKEQMEGIEARLLSTDDSTLDIKISMIENKGRGIKSKRAFVKGEFIVEYAGELISDEESKSREAKYLQDTSKGSYMYWFKHKGTEYCIDATGESGRYGRLLNHSLKKPNCVTKVVMLGNTPRLILVAKHDIEEETELLYDYGDRSKQSVKDHPWLLL